MVATIVPFGSEMYFATLLSLNIYNNLLLILTASLGNVLGSVFNWVCGYYINFFVKKSWFPIKQDKIQKDVKCSYTSIKLKTCLIILIIFTLKCK